MFESFIDPLKLKWQSLTKRDQQAAMILGIAFIICILIFGIAMPVSGTNKRLSEELSSAQNVYSELTSLAPIAMASGGPSAEFDVSSINSEVRRQAARFGVEVQRFEPDGERLKVWLEDSRYPSVIQWLGGLEAVGISHLELTMEDRPKPGFVSVRVTFGALN